jgi:hypothetical protein
MIGTPEPICRHPLENTVTVTLRFIFKKEKNSLTNFLNMFFLKERIVMITGSSSGIGAATAIAFAKYGARCILAIFINSCV